MTRIGVVRHKVANFQDWKGKFDERMVVRKNNEWAGHELYYDEANKEGYVVHTVKDDKWIWQNRIWRNSKLLESKPK